MSLVVACRPALQAERPALARLGSVCSSVEPAGDGLGVGVGEAGLVGAARVSQANRSSWAPSARELGDIIGLPVEAGGEIGERDGRGHRLAGAGPDRKGRPRPTGRAARRHRSSSRQAGAAQRLEPVRRLQHDRAVGARRGSPLPARAPRRSRATCGGYGRGGRATDRASVAGREQTGVAVALDDAFGKAADDRALRHDAAGDAFETDRRFRPPAARSGGSR